MTGNNDLHTRLLNEQLNTDHGCFEVPIVNRENSY